MRILLAALGCAMCTPAFAQEGCAAVVGGAELARHISKADVAFAQMDSKAFRAARWQADSAIPCLGAAV